MLFILLPITGSCPEGPHVEHGRGTYRLKHHAGSHGRHTWSQHGQDVAVDDILGKRRDGFFVEVGGFDGETGSNTLFLETQRNWTGLLIEAVPQSYEALRRRDRGCYTAHACIGSDAALTFRVAGQISSSEQYSSAAHMARIHSELRHHQPSYFGAGAPIAGNRTVRVRCYPLADLMCATGHTHVDYLSLDVEGAEVPVLRSIFEADTRQLAKPAALTVDIISVEVQEHRSEIAALLTRHGYQRVRSLLGGADDIYARSIVSILAE
eukprot:CAMPEP_0119311788 /NCGR_PEP_ID=MMETSP1333-20130426/23859_1 /TAXON_ID=418940 /ORGANISM="Scyphosphaera apsteinii, Strain RCC1455" /LENGTH=265 /DNA_ID=CAMNT_0007316259 /DNA_START=166 /DNA_END=963 /DNA_ORIENTATION=-